MTIPFYGSEVKFRFIAFFQLRVVKFSLKRAPIVFWAPVPYLSLYEGFSLGGKTISKESRYSPLLIYCPLNVTFHLFYGSLNQSLVSYWIWHPALNILRSTTLIKWSLSIPMLRIQVDTKNALNWLVIISTTTSNCLYLASHMKVSCFALCMYTFEMM